jgi:hypothetical protein
MDKVKANCKVCKNASEPKRLAMVCCIAGNEQRVMFGGAGYMYMDGQEEWSPPDEFCNGQFEEGENNVLCGKVNKK